MDILKRIMQLREERGWTEYRLSTESGIPQSTISTWFRKGVQPSVQSLQAICDACGVTLSQFFAEHPAEAVMLSDEQRRLLSGYACLNPGQREALLRFLDASVADGGAPDASEPS